MNDDNGDKIRKPANPRGRGFARMTPEERAEIARRGGKETHRRGHGHKWDAERARAAGRKGGIATQRARQERGESEP